MAEIAVAQNLICPMCGKEELQKPKVRYSIFKEEQPDYICANCGTPVWKRDQAIIPALSLKAPPLFLLSEGRNLLFLPEGKRELERSAPSLTKKKKRRKRRNTPLWVLNMWKGQDKRKKEKAKEEQQNSVPTRGL